MANGKNKKKQQVIPVHSQPTVSNKNVKTVKKTAVSPPSTKTGGGGGGGGSDPFSAQLKKQEEQQKRANRVSYKNTKKQIRLLLAQADAQKKAVSGEGYRKALKQRIKNLNQARNQQNNLLLRSYRTRAQELIEDVRNTERDLNDKSFQNLLTRSQERTGALEQAAMQGAGESDTLRALGMSLRSWSEGQSDLNRGFYDTIQSIDSTLTNLTEDTRIARGNLFFETEAAKESAWSDYYDQRTESLIQLGNTYGSIGGAYATAATLSTDTDDTGVDFRTGKVAGTGFGKAKSDTQGQNIANKKAANAYEKAANMTGKAYETRALPNKIKNWEGATFVAQSPNFDQAGLGFSQQSSIRTPEGSTLRRWE